MEYKDYYRILGIPKDADEQTIKSAYRRMARTYHPDVNPDKATATEKFKEINEAYTVLSDADKRRRYDSFGSRYEQYQRTSTQTSQASRPGPAAGGGGYTPGGAQSAQGAQRTQGRQRTQTRTIDPEEFERIFRGFAWTFTSAAADANSSTDFSDFFEALFGGRWGGAPATPATRDIELDLPITLEEAFSGTKRNLRYSDGRRIEVSVPRGVDTGSRLRIRGEGERASFGRRGDLYLTVQVSAHPLFTRDGNDLRVKVAVDAEIAEQSGQVQVPTLERPVMLKIPAGTQTGRLFRLSGLGMPTLQDPTVRGDLLVDVAVKPPVPKPQAGPAPKTKAKAAPKAQTSRQAKTAAPKKTGGGIRYAQSAGIALVVGGLVGVGFQVVTGGALSWLILLALGLILLSQAVSNRSFMLAVAGLGALLGGGWFASQTGLDPTQLLAQGWPLIPLALGLALLPPSRRTKPKT